MRKSLAKAILCSVICAGVYGSSFVVAEAAEDQIIHDNGSVTVENNEIKVTGYGEKDSSISGSDIVFDTDNTNLQYIEASNGKVNISKSDIVNSNGVNGSRFDIGSLRVKDESIIKVLNGYVKIGDDTNLDVGWINGSFLNSYYGNKEAFGGKVEIIGSDFQQINKINIKSGRVVGNFIQGTLGTSKAVDGHVIIKNATVTILSDGSASARDGINGSYITGKTIGTIEISDSSVNIENSNVTGIVVTGGNVFADTGTHNSILNNNDVYIGENSKIEASIYGSRIYNGQKGTVSNGDVKIINSDVTGEVYGGYNYVHKSSNAINNSVEILGDSTVTDTIFGGVSRTNKNGNGVSDNNTVIIDGLNKYNTQFADIYGGYVQLKNGGTAIVKNNTVILRNEDNAQHDNSNLYGYEVVGNNVDSEISNNNLIVDNWSGTVGSVNNFNNIKFQNIEWENAGRVLTLKNNEADSLKDSAVDVKESLTINNSDTKLHKGDYMYFVYHDDESVNLGTQKVNGDGENVFTSGVAVQGKGKVEVEGDGDVKYTITDVETTDQSKNTTDYNSVAAAFLITGSDLVVDGLNSMEQDQLFGTKTFAIVEGVDKTFEVADDLKVNGWNGLYGVGNIKKTENGALSYAAFFENGTANYRTYNTFMDEAFRGDGSIVYNGGGIAGRYKGDDGVYAEASVRAGLLKNQMKNVFRDGNGQTYGYKTESPYWALHAGVGKIYDVGYNRDLDVYARYYHTYNDGDSFTVAGDHFDVDDIVSDRLRLGLRYNTNKFNKWKTYYGAAWEYEFNGDSKVHINGDALATESLKGSSCFAEIGFNYQRDKSSPWDFEGRVRGYAGHTKGFSGMLRATYSF